jgi:hypothetical protein
MGFEHNEKQAGPARSWRKVGTDNLPEVALAGRHGPCIFALFWDWERDDSDLSKEQNCGKC